MIEIQSKMASRALELLALPDGEPRLLLDIGCGTGLSGAILSDAGHIWIGLDISQHMLKIGKERNVERGDLLLGDMGQGLPLRTGTFDGAISISALQWLCNQDKKSHKPIKRLMTFFQTLYNLLVRGARAVFQFYPENPSQVKLISECAMRCGFTGGVVIDYPNSTKAKKFFLCLFAGVSIDQVKLPRALTGVSEEDTSTVTYARERARQRVRERKQGMKVRTTAKTRDWVLAKKEKQRNKGKKVKNDSRYTARRRPKAF